MMYASWAQVLDPKLPKKIYTRLMSAMLRYLDLTLITFHN